MNTKTLRLLLLACPLLLPLGAIAHEAGQAGVSYVGDMNGHVVIDGRGKCVRTSAFTPNQADDPCAVAPTAMPAAKPEPVAAPAPAPMAKPAAIPSAPQFQTANLSAGALFDVNKAELKPAGKQELDALARRIKAMASIQAIRITGHTDSLGSAAYNQQLSQRRANSVKDYLIKQGIDGKLISATGLGESRPIASNATPEGRARNRRVEISISGMTQVP